MIKALAELIRMASEIIAAFAELAIKLIDRHSEFLVEMVSVLAVYFGVAALLAHYAMTGAVEHWLLGGALLPVLIQAFRKRLGVDETKPEDPKKEG